MQMSYYAFITRPDSLGITSCVSNEFDCSILSAAQLEECVEKLRNSNPSNIHHLVTRGKIIIVGRTTTMEGYLKEYVVNDEWKLTALRYNRDTWFYKLTPTHITSVYSYKQGLRKIAKTYLENAIDINLWICYDKDTKIFCIEEFSKILASPILTTALAYYTPLFSVKETEAWQDHYQWNLPEVSFIYRKYLKRQLEQHQARIKKMIV